MTGNLPPIDNAALGIKVEALEVDVREVNDRILGLDAKLDKAVADLAREVRSAVASLASQFNERQRTPWAVLISGAALIVTVLAIFGGQALSPIQSDLKTLKEQFVSRNEIKAMKEQLVPRDEIAARAEANNRRLMSLETLADQLQRRRYEESREELRRLQGENDYLRRNPAR